MKFNCGPVMDRRQWHRWFAWRPVRVSATRYVWLETVWRKKTVVGDWGDGSSEWEYREQMLSDMGAS